MVGLPLLASGVLVARRQPLGAWLFAAMLAASTLWALWDAGLHFWPLVSRLFAWGVLGLLVLLAYPGLARAQGIELNRGAHRATLATLTLILVATAGYAFVPTPVVIAQGTAPAVVPVAADAVQKEWRHWAGSTAGEHFAALDQITPANVDKLQAAWTAHTGDIPVSTGAGAEDQNTPLQIGDTLYVCTPYSKVLALDVDTGKERWRFDAKASASNWQRCRGLGYYEEPGAKAAPAVSGVSVSVDNAQPGACPRRILLPTLDARLIAINADNGQPCADFGNKGTVDLKAGMGQDGNRTIVQLGATYAQGPLRAGYIGLDAQAPRSGSVKADVFYHNLFVNYDYGQGKVYAVFLRSNNVAANANGLSAGQVLGNVGGSVNWGTATESRTFDVWQVSADYRLTPAWRVGALWGAIRDQSGSGQNASGGSVGAYYALSRRTTLSGMWEVMKNDAHAGFRPVGSGGLSPNVTGDDVNGRTLRGVQLGILHRF